MSFLLLQTLHWSLITLQIQSDSLNPAQPGPCHPTSLFTRPQLHEPPHSSDAASSGLPGRRPSPAPLPELLLCHHHQAWLFLLIPGTPSERLCPAILSEAGPLSYSLPTGLYLVFTEFILIYNYFINALALCLLLRMQATCGEQFCLSHEARACNWVFLIHYRSSASNRMTSA